MNDLERQQQHANSDNETIENHVAFVGVSYRWVLSSNRSSSFSTVCPSWRLSSWRPWKRKSWWAQPPGWTRLVLVHLLVRGLALCSGRCLSPAGSAESWASA